MLDPSVATSPTSPPETSSTSSPSRTIALSETQLAAIVEAAYLREITQR